MSRKKSIASAFGNLAQAKDTPEKPRQKADISAKNAPSPADAPANPSSRVAAGVIGATQRSLTEIREERDRLLAEVKKGGQIITLAAGDIDPSPFRDRLPDDDEKQFQRFKKALEKEGQRSPISVRRNPDDEHRYQIVFGHRRWRALKELGRSVEARIGEFSNRDLVVAQGMENAERQDLSFIERALFCAEMEQAGIKPKDIKSALGVDDAQMSKFRTVTRALPRPLIEMIGRAPNIGRPRWLDLARLADDKDKLKRLEKTLSADKVRALSSDDRFAACFVALVEDERAKPQPARNRGTRFGDVGEIAFGKSDMRIKVPQKHAEAFKAFMQAELPALEKRFVERMKAKQKQ